MRKIAVIAMSLASIGAGAGSKELAMNCSISTEPGHTYGSQMKLVAGMITEVPLKRENVKARFQFNDLHDYVKLEAWNQTTGTVAVTEVYAISVAKKVVLTSYQSKPGSLNFHFRCDVE